MRIFCKQMVSGLATCLLENMGIERSVIWTRFAFRRASSGLSGYH
jgi:hypothetical protein